jgi:hypothetical protein
MDIEVSNSLYKSLKQVLLLTKEDENSTKSQKHVLAMLGLTPKAFPNPIHLSWDAEDILVQTVDFPNTCTCATTAGLKTALVNDERHSKTCALAQRQVILGNPWLTDVERDDDTITWLFQWPRDIEGSRLDLGVVFPELVEDDRWAEFLATWKGFTNLMDAQRESYSSRMQADLDQEAAMDAEAESVVLPSDPDGYDDGLEDPPMVEPAPSPDADPVQDDQPVEPPKPAKRPVGRPRKERPTPPPSVAVVGNVLDIDLTVANVTLLTNNALNDLTLGPNKVESWTQFSGALKAARTLADAVETLLSQPGAPQS